MEESRRAHLAPLTIREVCRFIVEHISPARVSWGAGFVRAALRLKGVRVSRRQVDEAIRALQPNVAQRPQFQIQYTSCDVPMFMWQMGLYDKLSRYHLWVHVAMDVATQFLIWIRVEDNKRETPIFRAYVDAVCFYWHPQCLQPDFAAEHNLIAADMLRVRPGPRGSSFIRERPVQRIPYFWRSLWQKWACWFAERMEDLEYSGELDVDNPWHIHSLHATFLPDMKADLEVFHRFWNMHQVKAGRTPAHVPKVVFQEQERSAGLLPPPPYEEGVENLVDRREARGYTQNVAPEMPPLGDIQLLTGDLLVARDNAYAASLQSMNDLPDLYRIHLAITWVITGARPCQAFAPDSRPEGGVWHWQSSYMTSGTTTNCGYRAEPAC